MSVLKKLNEARELFHAQKLEKTGHNKFAGYSYFQLGDFVIPALQIFNQVGLCSIISFTAEQATMTITDLEDNSSVQITSPMSSAALKGCHDVQNLGAVQTYLRRYLWVAALEIVEHDPLDSSDSAKKKGGGATPSGGAWERMDEEAQAYLEQLAARVKGLDIPDAVALLEGTQLDADEKVALWTRFDSKFRAAIKKFQQETK